MNTNDTPDWRCYTNHVKEIADMVNNESWGRYKKLVKYRPEHIDKIHKIFIRYHANMKSKMVKGTKNLNRYKIISAYAKAVLKYPLFIPDEEKAVEFYKTADIPAKVKFPNAFFIFIMITSLMQDYCMEVKANMWDKKPYIYKHPVNIHSLHLNNGKYEIKTTCFVLEFIKFLCYHSTGKYTDNFPIFAFSNNLRLMEMLNDCANYGYANKYY
jgi:hypothetical protein